MANRITFTPEGKMKRKDMIITSAGYLRHSRVISPIQHFSEGRISAKGIITYRRDQQTIPPPIPRGFKLITELHQKSDSWQIEFRFPFCQRRKISIQRYSACGAVQVKITCNNRTVSWLDCNKCYHQSLTK